jgi:hypothetical protein
VSVAALLLAVALAGVLLPGAGRAATAVAPLAGLSLLLVGFTLALGRLLALPLLALAAEFVLRETLTGTDTTVALLYGPGLLLLCELLAWAGALRPRARVEPAFVARRAGHLLAVAAAAVVASAAALAGGALAAPQPFVAGVAGAAAAVALLALVRGLGSAS